jgi:hypothetical protein
MRNDALMETIIEKADLEGLRKLMVMVRGD